MTETAAFTSSDGLSLADVEFRVYDGLPHNICGAVPDRCAADVRDFLSRRFGTE